MATEYGFVYFLGNRAMPGIYKIGFTTNHPKTRIAQLSSSTSCPLPFDLLACFGVANPRDVENEIHEKLDVYRLNSSREFFKCSPLILQQLLREYSDGSCDLVNSNVLDYECFEYSRNNKKQWKMDHFYNQSCDPIHWPVRRRGFD